MKTLLLFALLPLALFCKAQDGFKPIVNPPSSRTALEALKQVGQFQTFLNLINTVGAKELGLASTAGKNKSSPFHTILAPTDKAFEQLPANTISNIKKDKKKLTAFLKGHLLPGKVRVMDMFDNIQNSYKEFKTEEGYVLGFECDRHTGMHFPRIGSNIGVKAKVGKFQDVAVQEGLIHEIDGVLIK